MTRLAGLLAAAAALAACGDPSPVEPPVLLPDARVPDATPDAPPPPDAGPPVPDAAPDATPVTPPVLDRDGDGVLDADDCSPGNPTMWRTAWTWYDNDRDGHGVGVSAPVCYGDALPARRSLDGTDCDDNASGIYQQLPYAFRDADLDQRVVAEAGTVCSGAALPRGYLATSPGTPPDCAPTDRTRFVEVSRFADEDDDGFGVGDAQTLCIGATEPEHWARVGGDCATPDRDRWQMLSYSFRDIDGDGVTVAESGSVCTGAALPEGYRTVGNGDDCAPRDPLAFRIVNLYADGDHDGVGAGAVTATCIGRELPPETSTTGTDCAPDDIRQFQMLPYSHVNRDRDRATAPERGTTCSGAALVPPYFLAPIGHDCDDDDDLVDHWVVLYADGDGDGVGAGRYALTCVGDTLPEGMSTGGYDIDDNNRDLVEDEDEDDELFDLIF